jgi:hypothetical protein
MQFQNNSYYYTLFFYKKKKKIVISNVLYDKRDNIVFVFDKFQEGIRFSPPNYLCNEYVLSSSQSDLKDRVINSSVLDEENRKKLEAIQEDDNPFIIKYYFK